MKSPRHRHHRGHLLYATEGVLLVQADTGQWLVPPTTAVWLRPGVPHQLNATTAVNVHGLFIDEILAAQLPDHDCVIHVTPLVRELIAALVRVIPQENPPLRDALLGQLLIEELRVLHPLPFSFALAARGIDATDLRRPGALASPAKNDG